MALSKELLDLLACPKCRKALAPTQAQDGLACQECGIVYPVREDIPILLAEEAINKTEWTGSPIPG